MSLSVSLNNPRAFGRESRVLIGGGILAGFIASVLGAAVGTVTPLLTVLTFGAILGLLANFSDLKSGTPMLRLVLSILGGIAWVFLMPVHWAVGAAVAGLFFGAAFSLDEGDNMTDRLIGWVIFAAALTLAVFTTRGLFSGLMDILQNVLSGATWGLFLAFASGLKRVEWIRNATLSSFRESYAEASGEERELLHSGRVLYEQILTELKRMDEKTNHRAQVIADETSSALIALTRRSGELKLAEERTRGRNLESRVFELDQKIAKTKDVAVKKELQASLREMVEQLRVRRRFGSARARLDARVQRCFTALERLHLSLVQVGSGQNDSIIEDSLVSMEKLAEEIRWRNLSVDELLQNEEVVDEELEDELGDTFLEEFVAGIREEVSEQRADSIVEELREVSELKTDSIVVEIRDKW